MNTTSCAKRPISSVISVFILLCIFSGSVFALAAPAETDEEADHRIAKEFADKKLHAEQGDPQAQFEWGMDCLSGEKGTQAEGLHWLLLASAQGHIEAEAQAGICYANGFGTEKNAPESVRMLRDAASKGSLGGIMELGILSMDGFGPLPKDLKQAEKYLSMVAEKSPGARSLLATVRELLKKEELSHADGKPSP